MRPTGMLARALALLVLLALTGCGTRTVTDEPGPRAAEPSGDPAPAYDVQVAEPDFDDPPPVTLHLPNGDTHDLRPWTYCLDGGCADGSWPERPLDVGRAEWVDVTFGVPRWEFGATFHEPRTADSSEIGRQVQAKVEPRGAHTFRVLPAGRAGTWHVDLFGRGEGGDVIVTFAWTTQGDGTFPRTGSGQASVLASNDGVLTSYGVGLGLSDLPRTPAEASASIEVVSDNGESTTFDLGEPEESWTTGSVSWSASERLGERAARLGGRHFTYRVTVVLDGVTHVGTATWPDDTTEEITPAVPLVFTPPLPAYGPG